MVSNINTEKVINCKDMVLRYLQTKGYDGLYCDDCGCSLGDLMPCEGGEYTWQCLAGYRQEGDPCNDGDDVRIGPLELL